MEKKYFSFIKIILVLENSIAIFWDNYLSFGEIILVWKNYFSFGKINFNFGGVNFGKINCNVFGKLKPYVWDCNIVLKIKTMSRINKI